MSFERERAEAFAGVGLREQDKQGKTPLKASEQEIAPGPFFNACMK